jgi:hypothetical protein
MIVELHKTLLVLLFSACALSANADSWVNNPMWQKSPIGKCFESLSAYLRQTFGDQYELDENIKTEIIPNPRGGRLAVNYVWAMDTTPSKNYSQVLFKVSKDNGKACAILLIPYSSSVSFAMDSSGNLPRTAKTQDTPPSGQDTNEVVYRLNPGSQLYEPFQCFKISPDGRRKKINCSKAYLD